MPRLGLALSGGGFRATLFHLGVIRFLRDAGLLADISHIVSVSGGSILAGHLVLNWDKYNGSEEEFDEVASKIIDFVQLDVRNRIVRRLPLVWSVQMLRRITFQRRIRRYTPNGILENYYNNCLFGDKSVHELPEKPELHILATNVSEGCLCSFNREGITIQRRGERNNGVDVLPARLAKVSLAVAASSAFPGFFPPVRIRAAEIGLPEGVFPTQAFTDGGVFDNLGVRAFGWWKNMNPPLNEILVSDTGQLFRILPKRQLGIIGQAIRASDILWDRVWQLEKLNFGADPRFLFIPATELVDLKEDPTAINPVIQPEIQNIRTDLDRFSSLEIQALVGHGYCVARKKCRSNPEVFGTDLPSCPPWNPLAPTRQDNNGSQSDTPTSPHQENILESQNPTEDALKIRSSANRRVWSTLFDFGDWPTYVYIPLLILLFVVLPYLAYRTYRQAQTNQMVIDSISRGDPEFRKILELVRNYPDLDFTQAPVENQPDPYPVDLSGFEFLESTRIIDLRRWNPRNPELYTFSRTRIRKSEDYQGDNKVRFSFPVPEAKEFAIRLSPKIVNPRIIKTDQKATRIDLFAGNAKLWQTEYDLTEVPVNEGINLTFESQWVFTEFEGTTSYTFTAPADIAITNVWILFPEDRPYRKYLLLKYEPEKGDPKIVEARYNIDHPYGTIIGWSMVNVKKGQHYSCKWEWDDQ